MLARYTLFAWPTNLSKGGFGDLAGASDEIEELVAMANTTLRYDIGVDSFQGQIVELARSRISATILDGHWVVETCSVNFSKKAANVQGHRTQYSTYHTRTVYVPMEMFTGNVKHDLGRVYWFGQNDNMVTSPCANSKDKPSLLVGSEISLYGERYRIGVQGYEQVGLSLPRHYWKNEGAPDEQKQTNP